MAPEADQRAAAAAGAGWLWCDADDAVEVRFAGRGGLPAEGQALARAWARQIHSATVLPVDGPGLAGEGDALLSRTPDLALTVVTADCVPVLLAAGEWVAAVHAGWRGIAAGVVGAAAKRLAIAGAPPAAAWTAWIGPAIGGCCYEVGPEVADQVAAASGREAVVAWPDAPRPHLDLARAVALQLAAAGVGAVRSRVTCTRCDAERLYSYRRDGRGAGRNLALIWKRG
jgi:purine-nucleoside/S-methyl-5'-thioadenosine phosphorylase / adenosine deaminase